MKAIFELYMLPCQSGREVASTFIQRPVLVVGSLWLRALKMGRREENTGIEQDSSILLISNIPTQKISLIRKITNISSIQLRIKTVPIYVVSAKKKFICCFLFVSIFTARIRDTIISTKMI